DAREEVEHPQSFEDSAHGLTPLPHRSASIVVTMAVPRLRPCSRYRPAALRASLRGGWLIDREQHPEPGAARQRLDEDVAVVGTHDDPVADVQAGPGAMADVLC